MAAQAQQVISDMTTGDTMHAMMQSLGGYQQSVQKEQTDPDIVAAQKKSADVSKEAQATVDQTGKNIEQEGVDLANATKPWNADQEMAKYTTPAIKAFGSAGSVFAILASAFTHQPMVNALNGAAAAMNAIRAGDADAYNKAYDAYKENTDLALKRHEMMMDDFKSVVDLSKTRMDLASAALTQLQAKYGDQQTAKLAELGAWDKIGELWNSRDQTALKMKELDPELEEANMKNMVFFGTLDKWRVDHGAKVETDAKGNTKITGGPSQIPPDVLSQAWTAVHSPQTVVLNPLASLPADASPADKIAAVEKADPRADMIAHYRMPPPSGFGSNNPNMKSLYDDVAAINPDYSAPRYNEVNKAISAFGTGKQGDAVRVFNVAVQHIDVAQELAEALHNRDTVAFNAARQAWSKAFGSDAPTNFDTAKHFLATEVSKAITGSGNAGALTDRQELEGNINNARSWEQLAGGLNTFKKFMIGQVNGYKQQYQSSTGLDDFDSMLLPETREQLEAHQSNFSPDPSWPSAKGVPDDHVLMDGTTVVAKAKNGQWVAP